MSQPRKVYANGKQRTFFKSKAKTRAFVGGRGCGKTHELSLCAYAQLSSMPRCKIFLSSTTYHQIATKTWPGIAASWEFLGLKEGIHFVYGIKPPKSFAKPRGRVKNYKNFVSMRNGSVMEFLSMERPDYARGGSYDGGQIDEAALIKQEHWTRVLLPAVRGNRMYYEGKTHWWQMVGFFTSMPWKPSGLWILDYEQKALEQPDKYFYLTANAYDNIEILGEAGIQRMREELTYMEFQMEVMNERIVKTEDAFYEGFVTDKHGYQPTYLYGQDENGRRTTERSLDWNPDAMLEGSLDFGGWFNCMSIYQEKANREERMICAHYVKGEQRIKDLVNKVCDTFEMQRYKHIRLWGEPRGHDKNALMTDTTYDVVVKAFRERGWSCEVKAPKRASTKHVVRREFIGSVLAEDTRGYPHLRINLDQCKWVVLAIQTTQTNPDGTKNKKMEKERNFPQEQAPHITDTIDYYFDQKWGGRVSSGRRNTLLLPGSADFY